MIEPSQVPAVVAYPDLAHLTRAELEAEVAALRLTLNRLRDEREDGAHAWPRGMGAPS